MKRKKPATYEADAGDRKVRVTVPEDPEPEDVLADAIRDNLSPKAVATVVAFLRTVRTDDGDVDDEVRWFAEHLTELLGGGDAQNRLADQQPGRKDAAVARRDNAVARTHLFGVLQELEKRGCGRVAGQDRALPGRLDRHRDPASRIGQQQHARGRLPHARDPPDQAKPVGGGPAVADAIARAHVEQHRLAEGRPAVGQHHAGDEGQRRVKPHLVEVE